MSIYDHAPGRKWRHLDTMQYKTYKSCRLLRVKDKEGKVETVAPPWASKHERHTFLFERFAIDLLLATKNQTKLAKILRCDFNVVKRIMYVSAERGPSRRNYESHKFDYLSIDEKSFKKGRHQYVSALNSPKVGCVIDVAEGRTKESVRSLFDSALSKEQQESVQAMSIDMWKAFISVVRERMSKAKIVHDRFHLIKYLNEAIDKVKVKRSENPRRIV